MQSWLHMASWMSLVILTRKKWYFYQNYTRLRTSKLILMKLIKQMRRSETFCGRGSRRGGGHLERWNWRESLGPWYQVIFWKSKICVLPYSIEWKAKCLLHQNQSIQLETYLVLSSISNPVNISFYLCLNLLWKIYLVFPWIEMIVVVDHWLIEDYS